MSDYPDLFSVAILSHPSRRCGHGPNSECKHLPTDLAVMRGAQAHELSAAEREHQADAPAQKRTQTRAKSAPRKVAK